jgi:hypothetical protein
VISRVSSPSVGVDVARPPRPGYSSEVSTRLLVPLQAVQPEQRAAVVKALAAELARRLEALFPEDARYRRSLVVAPPGSFEEAHGLLELRVTQGDGWGLRVRLDPAEDEAVRLLVDARPPWLGRAFALVGLIAGLAGAAAGAYGWWHGNRATAVLFALPAVTAVALAGLLLVQPLRWRAALTHREDVARLAAEVEGALATLRAAHPAVGAPRRAWSPAAAEGLSALVPAGLAAATTAASLSPALDAGWLCLLAPLAALFGCVALAFLVRFVMAALGLSEGGRLAADDDPP